MAAAMEICNSHGDATCAETETTGEERVVCKICNKSVLGVTLLEHGRRAHGFGERRARSVSAGEREELQELRHTHR